MVRNPQLGTDVPACAVQDEHDLLAGAGADLACERGELDFEVGIPHPGGQMKDGPSGTGIDETGMDEADQVAPGKTVLHSSGWPLTHRCPDASEQRFEADAMLIGGPQFDVGVGIGRRDRLQQRP